MYHRRARAHAAQLRGQCAEQLQGIEITHPHAVEEVCRQLAAKRGRSLHLHALPDRGGINAPCGLIVSFADADHIFHVTATSERHREQIIRHELAHLLLGHSNGDGNVIEALLSVLPDEVDPAAVVNALGRTSYDSTREYDAELAASYLGELFEDLAVQSQARGRQGAMARLDDALGHPRKDRRS